MIIGFCYFISFLAHESQYFSIMVAPSTENIASWVAGLPQLTQYFVFPPTSTSALIDEYFFSILCLHLILLCNCTYSICLPYASQIFIKWLVAKLIFYADWLTKFILCAVVVWIKTEDRLIGPSKLFRKSIAKLCKEITIWSISFTFEWITNGPY